MYALFIIYALTAIQFSPPQNEKIDFYLKQSSIPPQTFWLGFLAGKYLSLLI
jgi:hypothetical protein